MVGDMVISASIMGFLVPSGNPNSTQNIFKFVDFFRVYLLLNINYLIILSCVSIMILTDTN